MSKALTRQQVESRKAQAVRFVENVLDDPDHADEIDDESLDDWAERKGIRITNPNARKPNMATTKSKAELEQELLDAQDYIDQLEEKLDDIAGIATDDEEDAESEDGESDDLNDDPDGE